MHAIEIRFTAPPPPERVRSAVATVLRRELAGLAQALLPQVVGADALQAGAQHCLSLEIVFKEFVIRRAAKAESFEEAATEAGRALKRVIEKHADYLLGHTGHTPVMELNILTRTTGTGKRCENKQGRHFVKKMTEKQARAELDLGDEPGRIFFNMETGRPSVMLNHKDGCFEILEPGYDSSGGAGMETAFSSSNTLQQTGEEKPPGKGYAQETGQGIDKAQPAEKYNRFRKHLRCPACRDELTDGNGELGCTSCEVSYEIRSGVPVLFEKGNGPGPDPEPEPGDQAVSKNPYGQQTLNLINKFSSGLVLDCGSGYPPVTFSNVVHLEIVRYPGVDVVASGERLPFADGCMDAVVSEAVLEHVRNPSAYVEELFRVLKPGGEIRVDAAFLQPYHAYPHHYFNMTISGLELLMRKFEKIDSGCGPHQQPYVMLNNMLRSTIAGMPDHEQKRKAENMTIAEVMRIIEEEGEKGPFQTLTSEAVAKLAAGFYFYGCKPAGKV